MTKTPITIARGDGIGPAIMDATLKVLEAAGAQLDYEEIEIGKAVYERGVPSGIEDSSWESLNVTVRKTLGLFANVRPCVAYHPFVETNHDDMDLVIIRENEEDLYGGIEYRQSQQVMASLKLISRPGTERIVRYAFEYARANGRKKVTCMTKDNIMKMADGLFHKVFDEIGEEYKDIEQDHMIIDIGTAKVAANPGMFDVIVLPNLYGDIVSDVAAEVTGSVGLGGSSNIGLDFGMFEAVHGSAPDIAGQGIANPSGLILGAVMMLVHIGQGDVANKIHNAWKKTIEDGIHTSDIYREGMSKKRVGTDEFTKALINNLGAMPETLPAVHYASDGKGIAIPPLKEIANVDKKRVGVDVGLNFDLCDANALADQIKPCETDHLKLHIISNRGVKVWPDGAKETFCTDNWRLRFLSNSDENVKTSEVVQLLSNLNEADMNFTNALMLHDFDGEPGYTKAQGE